MFGLEEFDSFVCASLLHDIGKFYQRASTLKARHWDLSAAFVEAFSNSFYNPDLTKLLVAHHHESPVYTDFSDRPESIKDQKPRMLAYLISQADSLSSSERSELGSAMGFRPGAPLRTVFSQIDIGSPASDKQRAEALCYKLGKIPDTSAYPMPMPQDYNHSRSQYEAYVDDFLSDFRGLFPKPYARMGDTLLSLLQKYLWCVPSDTTLEYSDISLADHAKTTCALAACFYRFHEETGWDEERVRDSKAVKALIVAGDLSGIQDYIYGTASVGHGGVAKRLRGRSFRVSLLTELIATRLIYELQLPMACKIIAAGGQFYILVPNIQRTMTVLDSFKEKIENWLLRSYQGEVTVAFAVADINPDELRQGNFDHILDSLHDRLASAKLQKMRNLLSEDAALLDISFQGRPACPVCDRLPAGGQDEPEPCKDCELDAALGRRLIDCEWLVISENQAQHLESVAFLEDPTWYAYVVDFNDQLSKLNPVYCLNLKRSALLPNMPSGFMLCSGYAPRWSDEEELHRYATYTSRTSSQDEEHPKKGDVKTFDALAWTSTGDDLLGVLRADVDHLGLVFSLGMRGRASLSRVATLSSMLNLFFYSELLKLINQDFQNTYIAYAGGDDLMLIAPWNDAINLSKRIADEFDRFTAKSLTISAAVGTYKPKVPIATSSVEAGDLLERSKSAGRNRLTVFDTTIPWSDFELFINWADMLTRSLKLGPEQGGISRAFLYRLYRYQRQALRYFETHDTRALLFRPHLAYDIARNYTDDSGNSRLVDKKLHSKLVSLLESNERARKNWQILKAAIAWSSYATRERKED